jgi:hypothetical protein
LAIEVCDKCLSAVKPEGKAARCDMCGSELATHAITDERVFLPLLPYMDIKRKLKLGRNSLCKLYFHNRDADEIQNVEVKIESKILCEGWSGLVRNVSRGIDKEPAVKTDICPKASGETALRLTLKYTDARGAVRVYSGDAEIEIVEPEGKAQAAHVTVQMTNPTFRGIGHVEFSKMIELQNANVGPEPAPDDVCRILIPLRLEDYTPAPTKEGDSRRIPILQIPREEAGVCAGCFPKAMERARLVFTGAEEGRKVLLLTKPTVALGMKRFTKSPGVDLTLRLLPCRSEKLDHENWRHNRLISSPHATIAAHEDHFEIRDEPHSKNGTFLVHISGGEGEPALSVGDGEPMYQKPMSPDDQMIPKVVATAEVEGEMKPLPKGEWVTLPDRCEIAIGRRVLVLRAQTFTSRDRGLYALRLERVGNYAELEYVLVVKRVYIGSLSKCPVRVRDAKFPPLAAALDWRDGQFRLLANVDDPPIRLDGKAIPKRGSVGLKRPCTITIGDYAWRFEEATVEDFTEI